MNHNTENEFNYDNSANNIKNPSKNEDDLLKELFGDYAVGIIKQDNPPPKTEIKPKEEEQEQNHIRLNPDQQNEAERISISNLHQLIVNHKDEMMIITYPGNEKYLNRVNRCNYLVEKTKKKKLTLCHSIACICCMKSYLLKQSTILKQLELKLKEKSLVNYHITYHLPHNMTDSMSYLSSILTDTISRFKESRKYKDFLNEIGYVTDITAKEYSYSFITGHHPHIHEYNLGRILISDDVAEKWEEDLNEELFECYLEVTNTNRLDFKGLTTRNFFTKKRNNHHQALCLQSNFQNLCYITDTNKLYRGFELLKEVKEIVPNNAKFKKSDTYSYYFILSWRNDNTIDNDIAEKKYMEFINELPKTIDTISYGTVNINGVEVPLQEYFKVGDYANLSDVQAQELSDFKEHQTKITKLKSRIKNRYKKYGFDFDMYGYDKLLFYMKFKGYPISKLNKHLIRLHKSDDDISFLNDMLKSKSTFKLGFQRGYYSIIKDHRQLINHEGVDLPKDETDEEIRDRADIKCDRYIKESCDNEID